MKRLFAFILTLLLFLTVSAQTASDDLALVRKKSFQPDLTMPKYDRAGNNTHVLKTRKKSAVAKYNPATLVFKGTMYVYQNVLSPQLSRGCPYEITCSNFSKHAMHQFGAVKGLFLTADRVLRCNRIGLLDISPMNINERNGRIEDPLWQYSIHE